MVTAIAIGISLFVSWILLHIAAYYDERAWERKQQMRKLAGTPGENGQRKPVPEGYDASGGVGGSRQPRDYVM